MKRRTFLKSIGVAISPWVLLMPKATLPTDDVSGRAIMLKNQALFGKKIIEATKRFFQHETKMKPIVIEGEEFYVMFRHNKVLGQVNKKLA